MLTNVLIERGCDKNLVTRNFGFNNLFNCIDGILYKTIFDRRLIRNQDDFVNFQKAKILISTIGAFNKNNILYDHAGELDKNELIKYEISG